MELVSTPLPTKYGDFVVSMGKGRGENTFAIHTPSIGAGTPIVRLHSACVFSEAVGSLDCDCSSQLTEALSLIGNDGNGVVLYGYQEGRGQGLAEKIRAMQLMASDGLTTAQAYDTLGLERDSRNYSGSIELMQALGIPRTIRVATRNPRKISAILEAGFDIVDLVGSEFVVSPVVREYLASKERELGHLPRDASQHQLFSLERFANEGL